MPAACRIVFSVVSGLYTALRALNIDVHAYQHALFLAASPSSGAGVSAPLLTGWPSACQVDVCVYWLQDHYWASKSCIKAAPLSLLPDEVLTADM